MSQQQMDTLFTRKNIIVIELFVIVHQYQMIVLNTVGLYVFLLINDGNEVVILTINARLNRRDFGLGRVFIQTGF